MRILSKAGAACGLLCSWIGTPAQAQSWESLPALEQLLHQFLGKDQGETGGARHGIDSRLRLKKCPASPVIEKRDESLAIIHCEQLNWRISVPLVRHQNAGQRASSQTLVKRGQAILLVVDKDGFTISRQMLADRSGGLGDTIPVRSFPRSQPIMAEITGEGRVTLPSF